MYIPTDDTGESIEGLSESQKGLEIMKMGTCAPGSAAENWKMLPRGGGDEVAGDAEEAVTDEDYTINYEFNGNTASVNYVGISSAEPVDIVIPSTVYDSSGNPCSVTGINEKALYGNGLVKSVTFATDTEGDRTVTIGSEAFEMAGSTNGFAVYGSGTKLVLDQWAFYRSNVVSIEPEIIKMNGYSHFLECEKLTSVALSSELTEIPDYAFIECDQLREINITGITSIGEKAFSGCSSLNVSLPSGLTTLGQTAFSGTAMTKIVIPNRLTSIAGYVFSGCEKLQTVEFHNEIESIGNGAFNNCISLGKSEDGTVIDITVPDSVKTMGNGVFSGCTSLSSIRLPSGSTTIPDEMFKECTSLETFDLDGIKTIGKTAFYRCALTAVILPEGLKVIKEAAFQECEKLTTLTISSTVEWIDLNAFISCPLESVTFKSIYNTTYQGRNDPFWSVEFYDRMEGGVETEKITPNGNNSYRLKGYTFIKSNTGEGTEEANKLVRMCTMTLHYPEQEVVNTYMSGTAVQKPDDPEPKDRFKYWAMDGNEFDFDTETMPNRNIDLYPAFAITVTYKDSDGRTYYSEEAVTGEKKQLPAESDEVKKDGWVLVGWKIGSAAGDVHGIGEKFTADSNVNIDVIAEWYHGTDVVVFTAGGGELYGSTYAPLIDGKAVLETSVNPEYEEGKYNEFLGWIWTDESGKEVIYAQDLTLRASGAVRLTPYIVDYYQAEPRDIYYDYGEAEGRVRYQSAEVGKMVMLPTSDDAEYEGHRLAGWTEDGASVASPYVVTSEGWWHELSAVWESVSTVTFLDADGSLLKTFETVTGETIELCNGEGMQQGSALVGWKADSSETILGLGTDYRIDSDITFTAARIDAADVLIYVTSGGKMIGDTYTLIEEGTAVSETTIEKEGYKFLGWLMTDSDGNTVAYANGMHIAASGVVRLNAYLVPEGTEVHKVAYDFNEGTGNVTVQEAEDGQLIALQTSLDVQREGYKLTGWEISPATAVAGPYYAVTSEDVTLAAVWESIEPGPSPEPPTPIWDDDDDDPYNPTPAYDGGSSGGSDKTRENVAAVAVAAAAAVVMAFLAIAVFRRK